MSRLLPEELDNYERTTSNTANLTYLDTESMYLHADSGARLFATQEPEQSCNRKATTSFNAMVIGMPAWLRRRVFALEELVSCTCATS